MKLLPESRMCVWRLERTALPFTLGVPANRECHGFARVWIALRPLTEADLPESVLRVAGVGIVLRNWEGVRLAAHPRAVDASEAQLGEPFFI